MDLFVLLNEVMYFGCVCFRGELGFLNCDDMVHVVQVLCLAQLTCYG